MKMPGRAPNASLQLDYVRDTLFGPVAQRVECQCQLAALNLQGRPGLRLHVCPHCLTRSTELTVWPSSGMGGVITAWFARRESAATVA